MPTPYGANNLLVPAGTDKVSRKAFRDLVDSLDTKFASIAGALSGTLTARPAASASNVNVLYVVAGESTPANLANNGRAFLSVQTAAGPPATYGWQEVGLKVVTGVLADRPTTFVGRRLYVVTGDSTAANNGLTFLDTGSTWIPVGGGGAASSVRAVATSTTDVPVTSKGLTNQTGDLYQGQLQDGTPVYRVTSRGRLVAPVDASVAYAYDGSGRLSTVTVKDAGGTTILTSTLAYTGAQTYPTTQTDVGEGRTDTYTMTWNGDGTLASRTAVRS